jgi:hypothetical protein
MSPLPPGIFGSREGHPAGRQPGHAQAGGRQAVRRPIEDAKRLLMVEAGYPDGRDADRRPLVLNYDYYAPATPERKAEIDWMVRQFAKIWASSSRCAPPTTTSSRTRCARASTRSSGCGWNADYPDAENFLFLLYGPAMQDQVRTARTRPTTQNPSSTACSRR